MVPGISPTVNAGFNVFRSKMTKGGIAIPLAEVHARTVICTFVSLHTWWHVLDPTAAAIFRILDSMVTLHVSSQL